MRISDWSSDVCSSDLFFNPERRVRKGCGVRARPSAVGLRQPRKHKTTTVKNKNKVRKDGRRKEPKRPRRVSQSHQEEQGAGHGLPGQRREAAGHRNVV